MATRCFKKIWCLLKRVLAIVVAIAAVILILIALSIPLFDIIDERCKMGDNCLINLVVDWNTPERYFFKESQVQQAIACPTNNPKAPTCKEAVLLSGVIAPGMSDAFKKLHEQSKKPLVCLASSGGKTTEAKLIGDYILEHDLSTCMAEFYFSPATLEQIDDTPFQCSSSCPFILQVGNERLLLGSKMPMINLHREGDIPALFKIDWEWTTLFNGYYIYYRTEIEDYKHEESSLYKLVDSDLLQRQRREQLKSFQYFAASTPFIRNYRMTLSDIRKYSLFTSCKESGDSCQ